MKNKKQFLVIAVIISLMISGFQSCKKYEDGPLISFISRTERVSNTWKVDNYKVNGTDYTSLVTGFKETFTSDGKYFYDWGMISGTGTWAFQNKDEEIKITGTNNQKDRVLFITKLEEESFWYFYTDDDDKNEFHMVQF